MILNKKVKLHKINSVSIHLFDLFQKQKQKYDKVISSSKLRAIANTNSNLNKFINFKKIT